MESRSNETRLPPCDGHGIFIVETFLGGSKEILMTSTIQKWGNSLAVRIPKALAHDTQLENGSVVDLSVREGKVIIEPAKKPKYRLEDLLKGVTKKNAHHSVDTGPAVGREVW
jgi:antitoxin MazE